MSTGAAIVATVVVTSDPAAPPVRRRDDPNRGLSLPWHAACRRERDAKRGARATTCGSTGLASKQRLMPLPDGHPGRAHAERGRSRPAAGCARRQTSLRAVKSSAPAGLIRLAVRPLRSVRHTCNRQRATPNGG